MKGNFTNYRIWGWFFPSWICPFTAFLLPLFVMRSPLLIMLWYSFIWWVVFLSLLLRFSSCLSEFDYNLSSCDYHIYLTSVCWAFGISRLIFLMKFGKLLAIILSSNIFFLSLVLLFLLLELTLHRYWYDIPSHRSQKFISFFFNLFLTSLCII